MSDKKTAKNKFGYTKGGKVYRSSFGDCPDLEIGEVRESDEKSLEYFEKRFQAFEGKIDQISEDIKTAGNKGSFLMKLIHLREKAPDYNGIGDFESILKRIEDIRIDLEKSIDENRGRNLELKGKFLKEAEEMSALPEEKLKENLEKIIELKQKWVRTGAVKEDFQEEYEEKFRDLLNTFFERKRAYGEKKRLEVAEKTKGYKFLLSRVSRLRYERNEEAKEYEISQVLKEWKALPEIPGKLKSGFERKLFQIINGLRGKGGGQRQRTHAPRRQGSYQSSPDDAKILRVKEDLLSQAIQLRNIDLNEAVDQAKILQEKWLKSGKSTSPDVRAIYNKFREIIATIFERKTLEINVSKKFPDIESKTGSEKKILQISVMRDLIRKAKTDAKLFQENLDMAGNSTQEGAGQALLGKLRNQKFKIRIRENLLREIEVK